jgi:hypothetical protein
VVGIRLHPQQAKMAAPAVLVLLSSKSPLYKTKSQSFLTQPHGMCRPV